MCAVESTGADAVGDAAVPLPALGRRPTLRDYGLRALVVLFVLNAVDELDRAVLAVSLDHIADDFGLSDATVGLLPLAVIFITGLLSLPAGNLADRVSRTKVLAYGSIVWGGAGLLAAGAQSFVQLFLTRALLGVGQGTINPTHASLLSDYYPINVRGRALSYHRSANALGQVIGAVIGGLIIAWAGWRWGFVAAAVPGFTLGLYALSLREPKRGEADLNAAVEANPLLAEFLREPQDRLGFFESLGSILRIRTLRYLIATNAAVGFTLFGLVFWFPTFFEREYGAGTQQSSLLFGLLALAGFLGTWFGGPYADRNVALGFTRVARVCVVAAGTLAVSWTIGLAIPYAPLSFAFITIGGFLAAFGTAGAPSIVAACAPPRIRSQAFAAFGLALAVCGAAAAPVIVGGLSELFQHTFDMDEGAGLRLAMLLAVATVMSLGTWFVWQASKSAAEDIQRTIAAFIAEQTGQRSSSPS